ncbi:hypothetical protein [Oceanobacillus sp. FSL H7-0719]|uniref:hypothetical protein n=1 Tax=Oceanobacillus sp. FSL H7-0719 TaxID=2954507 RepID=UPI003248306F
MAGVLTVGIGGTAASIYAMPSQDNDNLRQSANDDISPQIQIQEIKDMLEAQGITLPGEDMDKDEFLAASIDAATKKELEEITDHLKAKKLSSDEALELRKQRISLPEKENKTDKFVHIDEKVKTLAKDILEKIWDGTMIVDESVAELTKLGVTLTDQEIRDLHTFFNRETSAEMIDFYNKHKEDKITRDEAREKIMKRRISLPDHEEND